MRELDPKTVAGVVIRYRRGRLGIFRYTKAQNPQGFEGSGKRQRTGDSNTKRPGATIAHDWMDEKTLADDLDDDYTKGLQEEDDIIPPGSALAAEPYIFLCGDAQLAAIYVAATTGTKRRIGGNHMSSSQLTRRIRGGGAQRITYRGGIERHLQR